MIRIALCDDNKEDMLQLHQKIIEWYRENSKNQSVSITEYSDSVYLSSVIDAGDSHDVFFLECIVVQLSRQKSKLFIMN